MDLTHASWFSGGGGLDLGLERAGWVTVSHSETDPYASAVLATHWPEIPNLGDITAELEPGPWESATLWSGGFPCQDLSIAGGRAGLAGGRSGLAIRFLDLVEAYRPTALLVENVPGLLSSHSGRDLGTLLGRMGDLGYGWAYRVLDGSYFGVPQYRRRVFIVGLLLGRGVGPDHPAEVLGLGTWCPRHPPSRRPQGQNAPAGDRRPVGTVSAIIGREGRGPGTTYPLSHLIATDPLDPTGGKTRRGQGPALGDRSIPHPGHGEPPNVDQWPDGPPPDAIGGGAFDGVAGWVDDHSATGVIVINENVRGEVVASPTYGTVLAGNRPGRRGSMAVVINENQRGRVTTGTTASSLTSRGGKPGQGYAAVLTEVETGLHPLVPKGVDHARFRVIGNGVIAPVAEWIGRRLVRVLVEVTR